MGEYVVRFSLPDGVFLPFVTTGWIFDIRLCENSSNQGYLIFRLVPEEKNDLLWREISLVHRNICPVGRNIRSLEKYLSRRKWKYLVVDTNSSNNTCVQLS